MIFFFEKWSLQVVLKLSLVVKSMEFFNFHKWACFRPQFTLLPVA